MPVLLAGGGARPREARGLRRPPPPPRSGTREPRGRREPRAPFCELLSVKESIKGIESGAGSVLDGGEGRLHPDPPPTHTLSLGSARYSPRYSPARPGRPRGGGRRHGDTSTSPQLQAKHTHTLYKCIAIYFCPTPCAHTVYVLHFCICTVSRIHMRAIRIDTHLYAVYTHFIYIHKLCVHTNSCHTHVLCTHISYVLSLHTQFKYTKIQHMYENRTNQIHCILCRRTLYELSIQKNANNISPQHIHTLSAHLPTLVCYIRTYAVRIHITYEHNLYKLYISPHTPCICSICVQTHAKYPHYPCTHMFFLSARMHPVLVRLLYTPWIYVHT